MDLVIVDRNPPVGEDVIDRYQRREGPMAGPGEVQALSLGVSGVAIAAVDQLAQRLVVEGGVEVAGEDAQRAVGLGAGKACEGVLPLPHRDGPGRSDRMDAGDLDASPGSLTVALISRIALDGRSRTSG